MGMVIYEPADLFWIFSKFGPSHSGIHHGRLFVDGHLPAPVSGHEAHDFVARGYSVVKWDGESWWDGWIKNSDGSWSPTMAQIVPLATQPESKEVPKVGRPRKIRQVG